MPRYTNRMRNCIAEVMGKGHNESSACAICTTSLQIHGEVVFEAAELNDTELRGELEKLLRRVSPGFMRIISVEEDRGTFEERKDGRTITSRFTYYLDGEQVVLDSPTADAPRDAVIAAEGYTRALARLIAAENPSRLHAHEEVRTAMAEERTPDPYAEPLRRLREEGR